MDANTIRVGYTLLFLLVALLHLYNALHYATLIRASFFITAVVFALFAIALFLAPLNVPLVALANAGIIATFIGALVIVQTIIALNGRVNPLHRRKGE